MVSLTPAGCLKSLDSIPSLSVHVSVLRLGGITAVSLVTGHQCLWWRTSALVVYLSLLDCLHQLLNPVYGLCSVSAPPPPAPSVTVLL